MEKISKEAAAINAQTFICELRTFPPVEKREVVKEELASLTPDARADLAISIYNSGKQEEKDKAVRIWNKEKSAHAELYLSIDAFRKDDFQNGAKLLEGAGHKGSKTAMLRFAYCLTMGIGIDPDFERAYKIYENLARDKVPCAVYFVGALQLMPEQKFIHADREKAQQKLMWSVNHGCKFAQFEQGIVEMRDGKNDAERAHGIELIKKAAEQNEVRAMLWLSIECAKGKLLPRDLKLAEKYLTKCKELGFT